MTAEVAVLNKQAVALAADSAVTINYGDGNKKIFNTLKIFALSKFQPVGVMVYSSVEVMEAPVETAIKVFRQSLGDKSLSTLDEYYDAFKDFLCNDKKLFTDEARMSQCKYIVQGSLRRLIRAIGLFIAEKNPGPRSIPKRSYRSIASKYIADHCQPFNVAADLPNVTPAVRATLEAELRPMIVYFQNRLKTSFYLEDADVALLPEYCLDIVLKGKSPDIMDTGFVVAGFGEDEFFPRLRSFEFESSVLNVHKLRDLQNVDMRKDKPTIIPFAQGEMIETFVRGRSSLLDEELLDFIDGFFRQNKRAYNTGGTHTLTERRRFSRFMDSMSQSIQKEFQQRLDEFTKENHIDPVEKTIGEMPKDELAKTAQALINLTTIHRRSTPYDETVGGPTDVAVISKGDGFIWIDRKHYFDSNRNLTFVSNYLREGKSP